MQMRGMAAIGVVFCSTILLLAQTLPPAIPHRSVSGYLELPTRGGSEIRKFQLEGIQYCSVLRYEDIRTGPEWVAAPVVPLAFDRAEAIARGELRKVVKDDSIWSVSEFKLVRCPKAGEARWFYAIEFSPAIELRGEKADIATVLVSLGGKAGSVRHYNTALENAPR
jgi:hypothetical protein